MRLLVLAMALVLLAPAAMAADIEGGETDAEQSSCVQVSGSKVRLNHHQCTKPVKDLISTVADAITS